MTALGVQALLTVLLGSAAFAHVARRGACSGLRPSVLLVLGCLVTWMGGQLVAELATTDGVAQLGIYLCFAGGGALGPAWLLLAARFTRSPLLERRPMLLAVAWVPVGLGYLALLTNDGHRLFSSVVGRGMVLSRPLDWGGPVFWASFAWQLVLGFTGVVMFLGSASGSPSRARRRQARVLAATVCAGLLAILAGHLEILPGGMATVPAAAGVAVAATLGIAVRYRLLDFLPLARRDVIDALSDAVVLTDAEGNVLDLNPAADTLLGARLRPLRGQSLARVLARLASDPEMESIEQMALKALESPDPVTVPLRTRAERELEVRVGSVLDRWGDPSARYAIIRDLTEARRFERLLRESQQRVVVGGLAAGLAHEVNNPLAFVASNLRQIHRVAGFHEGELAGVEDERRKELGELAEVVGETIEGVERIAEIIGRIIRPAALSEDEVVRLDLARVVRDAVRLSDFHEQRPVRTCVQPMEQLPEVDGCPERLSQALLNLLINARTAAHSCGDASLFVDAVPDGEGVAVRLGVCGPHGEPWSGSLPSIAQSAVAEAELSAAYETVREHGGTLETGGEPGTLFVMRLPAAPSEARALPS